MLLRPVGQITGAPARVTSPLSRHPIPHPMAGSQHGQGVGESSDLPAAAAW